MADNRTAVVIRAKIEAIKGEGEAKGKRCKKIKKKKERGEHLEEK